MRDIERDVGVTALLDLVSNKVALVVGDAQFVLQNLCSHRKLQNMPPLHASKIAEANSAETQRVVRALEQAQRRIAVFGPTLSSEEPWRIMLALFLLETSHGAVNAAAVCKKADIPGSSGSRWVTALTMSGWVVSYSGSRAASKKIGLTPEARVAIATCLAR